MHVMWGGGYMHVTWGGGYMHVMWGEGYIITYTQTSGQYQERERREHLKQYREKNKDRLQQKRHDYYGENEDRIKECAKQWKQAHSSMVCVQNKSTLKRTKIKSMNPDAVSVLKIRNK